MTDPTSSGNLLTADTASRTLSPPVLDLWPVAVRIVPARTSWPWRQPMPKARLTLNLLDGRVLPSVSLVGGVLTIEGTDGRT